MKVVRWLGAFGRGESIHAALLWELTQTERCELAAEPCLPNESGIRSRVGLLVKRSAVVKRFNGDCWSIVEGASLKKTRNPRCSPWHREVWVRPEYTAIVCKDWHTLSSQVRRTVAWFARAHRLPVLSFENFKEVTLPKKTQKGDRTAPLKTRGQRYAGETPACAHRISIPAELLAGKK